MKAHEHRSIGNLSTRGARVNLGGEEPAEQLTLRFGDVVALSGDFFAAEWPSAQLSPGVGRPEDPGNGLFTLARVPGDEGQRPHSRDELICALGVMSVDEAFVDERFEAGGIFEKRAAAPGATPGEVERRVRDRFLALATENDDHFVAPTSYGAGEARQGGGGSRFGSAPRAYLSLHRLALEEAWRIGSRHGDVSRGMAREAAAQHYLTDAFASGHLRTPIAGIREYWDRKYPFFWENLKREVAIDTAHALKEIAPPMRLIPDRALDRGTLSVLASRTRHYPRLNLGDLLGRVYHDWDNRHGLILEGGGMIFGDGHLDRGLSKDLAIAAVRAGVEDVEAAYALGAAGRDLRGEALHEEVRRRTNASAGVFRAEAMIPRLSPDNAPQNWWASSIEELWDMPIVGTGGTTVGEAVADALRVGDEVSRRLDCLGQGGIVEASRLLGIPGLGAWGAARACQAYHHGFIEKLAHDPRGTVLSIVHGPRPR